MKILGIVIFALFGFRPLITAYGGEPNLEPPTPTFALNARETMDEAWFTGPLDAPNPNPVGVGHFYAEPYFFGSIQYGTYDGEWNTHRLAHNHYGIISSTLLEAGVINNVSLALLPEFGYNLGAAGQSSSSVQFGDLQLRLKYRLHSFKEGSVIPTITLAVGEIFPTGAYDDLGSHPFDGFGSGAYTTRLALYFQDYFWMPNGRILRGRFDFTANLPTGNVSVHNVSVYGTDNGFRGHASVGNSYTADLAFEYSLTSRWVPVIEMVYQHGDSTTTEGSEAIGNNLRLPIRSASGSSEYWSVAPALEYNWNANYGIIAGAEITFAGRNAGASVTPQFALSLYF